MRSLAFDLGMTTAWGAVGDNRPPASGSMRLPGGPRDMGRTGRAFDEYARRVILDQRPDLIGFATPFIGRGKRNPVIQNGRPLYIGGRPVFFDIEPIVPDAIRPLMGLMTTLEIIANELQIACAEADESDARKAFMGSVPRKSKDIKEAARLACRQRGWPAHDHHCADALVMAAHIYTCRAKDGGIGLTPLFSHV